MISSNRTLSQSTIRPAARLAALAVIVLLGGAARAQTQSPAAGPGEAPAPPAALGGSGSARPTVVADDAGDYRVGARDVINVTIDDWAELSRSYEVTAGGTFLMPYAGRITAVGKTQEELAEEIATKLRGTYLKEPVVTVRVIQFTSRTVMVQGAVKSPGPFQIEGNPSVVRVIAVAGGLVDNHGSKAFVLRPKAVPEGAAADAAGDTDFDIMSVNLSQLYRGDEKNNIRLQPGDILHIPPADVFYVAGEVRTPGSFPLKDGTTLRQAISLAQGTTPNAARSRGMIFRDDPTTGKRTSVNVDVSKVMHGEVADIPISANDIIVIPNSKGKAFRNALLNAFTGSILRVPGF